MHIGRIVRMLQRKGQRKWEMELWLSRGLYEDLYVLVNHLIVTSWVLGIETQSALNIMRSWVTITIVSCNYWYIVPM